MKTLQEVSDTFSISTLKPSEAGGVFVKFDGFERKVSTFFTDFKSTVCVKLKLNTYV